MSIISSMSSDRGGGHSESFLERCGKAREDKEDINRIDGHDEHGHTRAQSIEQEREHNRTGKGCKSYDGGSGSVGCGSGGCYGSDYK